MKKSIQISNVVESTDKESVEQYDSFWCTSNSVNIDALSSKGLLPVIVYHQKELLPIAAAEKTGDDVYTIKVSAQYNASNTIIMKELDDWLELAEKYKFTLPKILYFSSFLRVTNLGFIDRIKGYENEELRDKLPRILVKLDNLFAFLDFLSKEDLDKNTYLTVITQGTRKRYNLTSTSITELFFGLCPDYIITNAKHNSGNTYGILFVESVLNKLLYSYLQGQNKSWVLSALNNLKQFSISFNTREYLRSRGSH